MNKFIIGLDIWLFLALPFWFIFLGSKGGVISEKLYRTFKGSSKVLANDKCSRKRKEH